ncbi:MULTISPECIES: hypothetical protein [unclassified Microcoleus]|uniref:hypothetical protein n=1 Tax=unclassified Microcoleus TaxID=2642155 RepID=UPI002FD33396
MIEFVRREMREENLGFCPQPRTIAVPGYQMMLGSQLDPAQKRIQVSDTRGGKAKILDSCSTSQIHLWSINLKSKIVRLSATRRLDSTERLPKSKI